MASALCAVVWAVLLLTGCSSTRHVAKGSFLLDKVSITVQGEESLLVFGDEQEKVAHYHCNCGYSSTDYEEFTRKHMYQHVLNGDRNSYCTTYE